MSRIYVHGLGAVSPAGWGVPALRDALTKGEPIPAKALPRPGWTKPFRVREVPPPAQRPAFVAHPRLRRTSPITTHAASAALEALQSATSRLPAPPARLGLVMCVNAGCVQYTERFFREVLQDPLTASPLVFPETVFNAPASHVACVLTNVVQVYSVLGDGSAFIHGLSLAADWLQDGSVDGCLVVGSEEINWLLVDVVWHYDHSAEPAGGAGAVYLGTAPSNVELSCITDPMRYSPHLTRRNAVRAMRAALPPCQPDELLCDSVRGKCRASAAELDVWRDWTAARLSPKMILGEGLIAAAAWQCVAACDALSQGCCSAANVSVVGTEDQAIAARFTHS
ncbi:MAG: hypothetical protein WCO56_19010 [Verrucomicrobiota bacterium]